MQPVDDIFSAYMRTFEAHREAEMSLSEYLEACRKDPLIYSAPTERLLAAIGEPDMVDTSTDPRLGRIFMNRTIPVYSPFGDLYPLPGMQEAIERIVLFLRCAGRGQHRELLCFLGSAGVLLAERLKRLTEAYPIYVLKAGDAASPVLESPLGLFDPEHMGPHLEDCYGIPGWRLTGLMSPWCLKRLHEFGGDLHRFRVLKLTPSRARQVGMATARPLGANHRDISWLVGKVDTRKLELYSRNDPDAYSYSGALNRANQGILEFFEMLRAPANVLESLLSATQEGGYTGTESIGAMPFQGLVIAHSTRTEWQTFAGNRNNAALSRRIFTISVPGSVPLPEGLANEANRPSPSTVSEGGRPATAAKDVNSASWSWRRGLGRMLGEAVAREAIHEGARSVIDMVGGDGS